MVHLCADLMVHLCADLMVHISLCYLLSVPAVYLILSFIPFSSLSHTLSANVLQMTSTCEAVRSNALLSAAHPMTRSDPVEHETRARGRV